LIKSRKEKQVNPQLEVLYKDCCRQSVEFLEGAMKEIKHPYETCEFYKKELCRSDFFCRQLTKKPVTGSWYADILQLKRWLKPGEAVYAKKMDTGGLTVTTDPFPFIGYQYPREKNGLVLISKRDKHCSCCRGKDVVEKTNLCKKCQPLYDVSKEVLDKTG
jgi:hypothetical protein